MFNEKWRQRLRKGGRILLYGLVVAYLLAVLDDLNSIQSNISEVESDLSNLQVDVSTIQGDVSSIESDVSSIEGDMPTAAHTGQHRPHAIVQHRFETISLRLFRPLKPLHLGHFSLVALR